MLLTGAYERTIDEKLRLAMPKPFREAFEDDSQLVLTPGTDGSLSRSRYVYMGENAAISA